MERPRSKFRFAAANSFVELKQLPTPHASTGKLPSSTIATKEQAQRNNKVESSASTKKYRRYVASGAKRLRMTSRRPAKQQDDGTIDLWALFNPASAALEKSNLELFFPKAVDMETDVLFVLPSPRNKPSLALPRALTTPPTGSKPYSMKSSFADVQDVTRELAFARIDNPLHCTFPPLHPLSEI